MEGGDGGGWWRVVYVVQRGPQGLSEPVASSAPSNLNTDNSAPTKISDSFRFSNGLNLEAAGYRNKCVFTRFPRVLDRNRDRIAKTGGVPAADQRAGNMRFMPYLAAGRRSVAFGYLVSSQPLPTPVSERAPCAALR